MKPILARPARRRIAELSPFDSGTSEAYLPPGRPYVSAEVDAARPRAAGEADFGCVDWYQYVHLRAPTHESAAIS